MNPDESIDLQYHIFRQPQFPCFCRNGLRGTGRSQFFGVVDWESCEPLWAHANCMPHSVNLLRIQPTTRCPWEHSLTCWIIMIRYLYLEHRSETEHICRMWKRAVWVRRPNWSWISCYYFENIQKSVLKPIGFISLSFEITMFVVSNIV